MSPPMDESNVDIDTLKAILLEQRDALLGVVASGEAAAKPVELDQARVGRLSRMDAMQAQAMAQESDRRRQIALQRIANALQRIEDGDYGFCLACGEAVDSDRLEVDPAATLCIACAENAEKNSG